MGDSGRRGERLESLARDLATGEISRRTALRRFGAAALGAAVAGPLSLFSADSALGRCPSARRCNGKCCPKHSHCTRRGRCKCDSGYTKCSGKCFDLQTNPNHCGDCATVCDTGETCVNGQCQVPPPPSCTDQIKNGDETDVDCGGSCPPCENNKSCSVNSDCQSGFCNGGTCSACSTNSDCGGTTNATCSEHVCQSGVCVSRTTEGDPCGTTTVGCPVGYFRELCCHAGACNQNCGVCECSTC